MACYRPLTAYYSKETNSATGKRSMVFNPKQALQPDNPINLPCGQCIGCKLAYSARWAARCYHESKLHDENMFITLTFDNNHLPKWGDLSKRDCQLFIKKLRKHVHPKKIRVAYCGEYGEKTGRPHYHLLIFGHSFNDLIHYKTSDAGSRLYISKTLSDLWPYGWSDIGEVNFDSAAYVARYITKKQNNSEKINPQTGEPYDWKYLVLDRETGEILHEKQKEFFITSRRPGIGKDWILKRHEDVYNHDHIIIDGRKLTPPKFYDTQFEKIDPDRLSEIKSQRLARTKTRQNIDNNSYYRLLTREESQKLKLKQLTRRLDK